MYNKQWKKFDKKFYLLAIFFIQNIMKKNYCKKSIKYCKTAYYITNAQNELNYINQTVPEIEFEQIMECYTNTVEFNDSIESEEEFDANYVSDTENFYDLLQFSNETFGY
ncbi:hypothetical protein F8M41_023307 [Gigaspora margarita]|uniref:Uncharacterized protein n=1 Tax=Gigaspora margarita TaxID=4874 RepID=A0A8H4ADL8_GIGMA|nr:hypothetical protein F8M41_023307 [Gigaspora margarita]